MTPIELLAGMKHGPKCKFSGDEIRFMAETLYSVLSIINDVSEAANVNLELSKLSGRYSLYFGSCPTMRIPIAVSCIFCRPVIDAIGINDRAVITGYLGKYDLFTSFSPPNEYGVEKATTLSSGLLNRSVGLPPQFDLERFVDAKITPQVNASELDIRGPSQPWLL